MAGFDAVIEVRRKRAETEPDSEGRPVTRTETERVRGWLRPAAIRTQEVAGLAGMVVEAVAMVGTTDLRPGDTVVDEAGRRWEIVQAVERERLQTTRLLLRREEPSS